MSRKRDFRNVITDAMIEQIKTAAPRRVSEKNKLTQQNVDYYKRMYIPKDGTFKAVGHPGTRIVEDIQHYMLAVNYAAVVIHIRLDFVKHVSMINKKIVKHTSELAPLRHIYKARWQISTPNTHSFKKVKEYGKTRVRHIQESTPKIFLPNGGQFRSPTMFDFRRNIQKLKSLPKEIPIVLFCSMNYAGGGHANSLFINRSGNEAKLELFEPNRKLMNKTLLEMLLTTINDLFQTDFSEIVLIPSISDEVCGLSLHSKVMGVAGKSNFYNFASKNAPNKKIHREIDPGGYCALLSVEVIKHRLKYPRMNPKQIVRDFENLVMGIDLGPHLSLGRPYQISEKEIKKRLSTYSRIKTRAATLGERLSLSPEEKNESYGDIRRTMSLFPKKKKKCSQRQPPHPWKEDTLVKLLKRKTALNGKSLNKGQSLWIFNHEKVNGEFIYTVGLLTGKNRAKVKSDEVAFCMPPVESSSDDGDGGWAGLSPLSSLTSN